MPSAGKWLASWSRPVKQSKTFSALRVAIFTGAGERAFSAGMDLKERAETAFSPIDRRNQKLSQTNFIPSRVPSPR